MALSGSMMNPASRGYYADDLGKKQKNLDNLKYQLETATLQRQINEARNPTNYGGSSGGSGSSDGGTGNWLEDAKAAMQLRWQDDDRARSQNYNFKKQEKLDSEAMAQRINDRQAAAASSLYRAALGS